MIEFILNQLEKLVHIPSVSGQSEEITHYITNIIDQYNHPKMSYTVLNRGGILIKLAGKSAENSLLLSAHLDTLGAMVRKLNPDGSLRFTPIGSYSFLTVIGENCTIHSEEHTYTGTVLPNGPSVHADGRKMEQTAFKEEDFYIRVDEKSRSQKELKELGISVGDYISWDPRFTRAGDFVKSRHLDNKLGVSILLGIIEEYATDLITPERDLYILLTTWEEEGLGALVHLPKSITEMIVVDNGVMGTQQESNEYCVTICAKDSAAPFDPNLKNRLRNLARAHHIPFVIDIYPHYSSDAKTAILSANDIKTILISPGVHASHAYERTHIESINATYQLLKAALQ